MKKLRLKALSLGAKEILNREQLRSVTGGSDDVPWERHCPGQSSTQVCCRCEQNLNIMFTCDTNPPDYQDVNYSQVTYNTLIYCGYGGSSWCTPY
jgi:hypothetical protein